MFRRSLVAALCLLSLVACGSETATTQLSSSDSRTERLFNPQDLAARFAPIVRMHEQELYLPMDPEDFLVRPAFSRDEAFFRSARSEFIQGQQARTVVNISDDGLLIQYWLFYAKNGCQGARLRYRVQGPIKLGNIGVMNRTLELCNVAIHEGDWENVTLKLAPDHSRVEAAYLSAHGHGNWLPASALEFRGDRPYFYSALNSHAFYAKDIGFHADTTIAHGALDGALGIEWFQIGDIISGRAATQHNPSDGMGSLEFDTRLALLPYDEIQNAGMKFFSGDWGLKVNARDILSMPDLSFGPIEAILKIAVNVAFNMVPELKDKSNGDPPPSPWGRSEWRGFDNQFSIRSGLAFDRSFGGEGGVAFVDSEKLSRQAQFHVREIRIRSGDRIDRVCIRLDIAGEMCHGGDGGKEKVLTLQSGEYVQSFGMSFGNRSGTKRVFAVKFTTNYGRTLEGGSWKDETVWQYAPAGMQLVGWFGSSGEEVDSLGSIYGSLPD